MKRIYKSIFLAIAVVAMLPTILLSANYFNYNVNYLNGDNTTSLIRWFKSAQFIDNVTIGGHLVATVNNTQPLNSNLTTLSNPGNWKIFYSNGSGVIVALDNGASGTFLRSNGAAAPSWATGVGTGDVVGPASATDNQIVLFNGATGKLIRAYTVTGMVKATSGVISAATAGADYLTPTGSGAGLTGLTKTQVGLDNVENTRLSTWPGTSNITTVGTITAGVWNATAIAANKITPAGSNRQLLFNDNGTFNGTTGVTYSSTDNSLTAGAFRTSQSAILGGEIDLYETSPGVEYRGFRSPTSLTDNLVYTLPSTSPTANQIWLLGAASGGYSAMTHGSFSSPLSVSGSNVIISDNAITTTKLLDLTITGSKIADNTITPAKLNRSSGTADNTTYYRGDGVWASPSTGALADNSVAYTKLLTNNSASDNQCLKYTATGTIFTWGTCGSGSGDVISDNTSSTDNTIALFSGTTGKHIKTSNLTYGSDNVIRGASGFSTTHLDNTAYLEIMNSGPPSSPSRGWTYFDNTLHKYRVYDTDNVWKTVGQQDTSTITDNTSYASVYNKMVFVDNVARTVTLPEITSSNQIGQSICVMAVGANIVTIKPNANDGIRLNGSATRGANGTSIASSGSAGDYICLVADSLSGWSTTTRTGTWN